MQTTQISEIFLDNSTQIYEPHRIHPYPGHEGESRLIYPRWLRSRFHNLYPRRPILHHRQTDYMPFYPSSKSIRGTPETIVGIPLSVWLPSFASYNPGQPRHSSFPNSRTSRLYAIQYEQLLPGIIVPQPRHGMRSSCYAVKDGRQRSASIYYRATGSEDLLGY